VRAAGYFRVSTEQQASADRNSLDLQAAAFRARCAERGYEVAGTFSDVMSGRKNARPEYQRLLAAARAGAFDVIVVTWLDRFGRNDREITMRVLELQDAGITVEPTEEAIPDFITLVLQAWKAGQEVERIAARTSDGLLAAASKGAALGKAAFGYRRRWDLDQDDRRVNFRFEIFEPEARLVRWVFEQYTFHNASLRGLCYALQQQAGPHLHGLWVPREVAMLLDRERYTGVYTYNARANSRRAAVEVRIPGAIPAIISRDLFDAAQARRHTKAALPAGRTQTSTFLLSGILKCGHCGGPMHGAQNWQRRKRDRTGERVQYPFYSCGWHRRQRGCEFLNLHMTHVLDEAVVAFLEDVAGNVARVRDEIGERSTLAQVQLLDVKKALAEVDAKFERTMRLFFAGSISSEEQLGATNRILDGEKRRLTLERDRLLEAIAATAARQREVAELPEDMGVIVDPRASIQDRKTLVQRYIARVEVWNGEPIPRIYPRFFE